MTFFLFSLVFFFCAKHRDGLVAGLKKAVVEEKAARKREAKEREERRQAEMEAKREAKLAKARAEAAALAGDRVP
jgi:hypothetical protein